jgi:hypothetical protein
MSSESPVVVLYSSDGYELNAINGNAIPANTRGLLMEGSDGTNSHFISTDSSGRPVIVGAGTAGTNAGGVLTIQGNASGVPVPISGSITATNPSVGSTGATAPTSATLEGGLVVSTAPTYTAGNMQGITLTTAGALRIDGSATTQPVSGTGNFTVVQTTAANLNATVVGSGNFNVIGTGTAGTAASGVVTIQGIAGMTAVSVTGSGNFNNASVSSVAATPPTSATYIGASVTTAAPTYTNGQMDSISLTTSGLLRIDGVYPTGSAPGSDANLIAGSVTTSSPSYTTGQMNALSLTTAGALRVDASATTQPVSGTVTANAGTGSFTVAQATAANLNATIIGTTAAGSGASSGLVTIQGNASGTPVPVSGVFTTDKSSTSALTSVPAAVTSTSLLASNTGRIAAMVWNDSTAMLYLALSATASTTAYTIKLYPGAYWELPITYTGAISGVWNAANGNARVTELST